MKNSFFFTSLVGFCLLLAACNDKPHTDVAVIRIFPDSVLTDASGHRLGINVDFFMDGGRFPQPRHSLAEALKTMEVKYLRYPGGEKSDLYLFSTPPYDKSNPTLARTGGLADYPGVITDGKKLNYDPLDFDEFIDVCRDIGAEPVIVVAADGYLLDVNQGESLSSREELLKHAAEWVRYANVKMKYGVRYWMIGNESWNANNMNSSAEIYARDVIDFSKAMKAVDSSILIIPNGSSEEFFKTVITKAGDHIDRLCVSNYGVYNFHRGYNTYRDTTQCLIWPALTAIKAMNDYATPEQLQRFKMIVAEFGSIDWQKYWNGTNDLGHAIVTFDMAGQLLTHPQIEFSCFWNTRWIENEKEPPVDHDALDKDGNINPTGFALAIWGKFPPKKMVAVSQVTDNNTFSPVVAYSGYDPDAGTLQVYLINKQEKPVAARLEIPGYQTVSIEQAWEYVGNSPEDPLPVWQERPMTDSFKVIDFKGLSITVLIMKMERKTCTYYVDPVSGNDTNTGMSPTKAYRSLEKLRSLALHPGDSILLKSGAVFTEPFYLSCKGDSLKPVIVGKYGGSARPHIRMDASVLRAVHIFNSEHIVVRDLEISNRGAEPVVGLNGLLVELVNYGTARNITLDNLFVHDVLGNLDKENKGGGNAILLSNFRDEKTDSLRSRFDGLVVQNCLIRNCQRNGIMMWGIWPRRLWYPSLNVIIRNNTIEGVPGDGIVPVGCESPLVEYNVMKNCPATLPPTEACDGIWPWSCDNAVVQYNIVSDHKSQVDGYGFDADWNCNHTVIQYNLSFNNDGGFLLICNSGGWPPDWSAGNTGTVIRYNISINDGLRNFIVEGKKDYFSPVIHLTGPTKNTRIENNLFYLYKKPAPEIDKTLITLDDWGGYADSTFIRKNFIFVEEPYLAINPTKTTRTLCEDNRYTGDLITPETGFSKYDGKFDQNMWQDPKDDNWDSLIAFIRGKTVTIGGKEVRVTDIIGYLGQKSTGK
ncbi:MAG: right-handed parallel beta-helix repeat-containing protein [Bacteroidales bacterium]|nr:right-handed parallel beta-helix repeat-containing protein [Bacteroidales bacterium]